MHPTAIITVHHYLRGPMRVKAAQGGRDLWINVDDPHEWIASWELKESRQELQRKLAQEEARV